MKYRVLNPDLTLEDYFLYLFERHPEGIFYRDEEVDGFRICKVLVYIDEEPYYFVFKNDGQIPFRDGDRLRDFLLSDPDFFCVAGGGKVEFVEREEEADEVEIEYDDEGIMEVFFPKGRGWATFLGVQKY